MKRWNRYLDQDELRRLTDEPSRGPRMEFYIVSRMECSSPAAPDQRNPSFPGGLGFTRT